MYFFINFGIVASLTSFSMYCGRYHHADELKGNLDSATHRNIPRSSCFIHSRVNYARSALHDHKNARQGLCLWNGATEGNGANGPEGTVRRRKTKRKPMVSHLSAFFFLFVFLRTTKQISEKRTVSTLSLRCVTVSNLLELRRRALVALLYHTRCRPARHLQQ